MTQDTRSRAELAAEVEELRARLARLERQTSEEEATCLAELEQMRQARAAMELATFIVENSPAVLFRRLADETFRLVYVSENVSQWGYTAEQFLSREVTFDDIILPEDNARMEQEIRSYTELGVEEYGQQYRIRTADGEIRWVSDENAVIQDEEGNPLFTQGVLMDITRRKEAEEALSASEFKFRRTIEGAAEGYLFLDEDLIIREVNDAYCRMLGYAREDLLGKRPHDFATLEYQRFLEANREHMSRQDVRRFEGSMVHRDGHVVPVLVNASTLRDDDGDFLGNVAFVADITEQKKAVVLAGEVQKSLLPDKPPRVPGLDVAGSSLASEVAGGDYFDYLNGLDPEHPSLSVAVGDISGHGVDAALLMTTARGFLRMRAAQPGSPAQIVTEMNRQLATDLHGTGRFMTLFYLSLMPEEGIARWVRAGHDPAMIYCPVLDTFTELGGENGGLPVGVMDNSVYIDTENELHEGQIIAIGTDGIWEARSPEGEMYGKERFKAIVREWSAYPAQTILEAVFDAVLVFTGGVSPDDDVTLVIVKYGFAA